MSGFFYYLAAFALVLGVLILVHEFGHYLAARFFGVKVLRFSLGFGQTIWARRFGRDNTEWALGLFPLGGYVRMLDEQEGEVAPGEVHRSFNRQSVWARMAIVAAGPLANLLLAVFVYWGLFCYGTQELQPILGTPVADSPAAAAGIENGEKVLKIGGETVQSWQDMRWVLLRQAVERDSVVLEVINQRGEIADRRLDVSSARKDGWEGDALQKLGIGFYRMHIPPVIGKVSPDGVAALAGLLSGDKVETIDNAPIVTWLDVVRVVRSSPGEKLDFGISRNGQRRNITIVPTVLIEGGREIGRIGAGVREHADMRKDLLVTVRYEVGTALIKAIGETWDKSAFSLVMIRKMITGEVSWRNISGPVMIADYAGQSAKLGADYYLKFLALVSVSLAVLNLLPIPVLDGGHLLYYVFEIVRRKPLSQRSMEIGQRIGLSMLILLMAFTFYNDINRLISG